MFGQIRVLILLGLFVISVGVMETQGSNESLQKIQKEIAAINSMDLYRMVEEGSPECIGYRKK